MSKILLPVFLAFALMLFAGAAFGQLDTAGLSETFLDYLRGQAEEGDADCQVSLGELYYSGEGVSRDYAEAARWYRMAAEQGHAKAQTLLGLMHDVGLGVARDQAEAVRWYRLAAEQGHGDAQTLLGMSYSAGQGVPEDDAEAAKWYRLAAEQGQSDAQQNLGMMYFRGDGVPQDYVEAYAWFDVGGVSYPAARSMRDKLPALLSHEQIVEAQRRSGELAEQIEKNVAGNR